MASILRSSQNLYVVKDGKGELHDFFCTTKIELNDTEYCRIYFSRSFKNQIHGPKYTDLAN